MSYKVEIIERKYPIVQFETNKSNINPPGMRRRSDVSFRSNIGRDVADHAEMSSKRHSCYVNETDLFETSF